MTSPGKLRGLTTTATPGGIFSILAIDHRDSMRVVLDPEDPMAVPAQDVTDTKLWLLRSLGDLASGVMLDPEYSAAQAVASGALPGRLGFLAAIEDQGYLTDDDVQATSLLEGWGVEKAKRLGAAGVKLLVLYRPGSAVAEQQEQLIRDVVADCARYDIPLFLEPLARSNDPAVAADLERDRRSIVVESVRRLGALGPDVLKVPFPAGPGDDPASWPEACAELDEASPTPWAILSGGDPYERFRDQVRTACAHGASGFMVGRALWREAVLASTETRQAVVDEVVRPRLRELAAIAEDTGRPWRERVEIPPVDPGWYETY